jgi:hypothetical protein
LWIGNLIASDESAAAVGASAAAAASLLSAGAAVVAATSPPPDASSLSDPQADATIAIAARMTMNRFNMKTSPLSV